jgi:hypothetical protein
VAINKKKKRKKEKKGVTWRKWFEQLWCNKWCVEPTIVELCSYNDWARQQQSFFWLSLLGLLH